MLADIAKSIEWMRTDDNGDWSVGLMPPQSWKSVLTAAFEKHSRMAQGIDGGVVMVGASTSNYGKKRFAEFIEYLYWFGSDRNVKWSERSRELIEETMS